MTTVNPLSEQANLLTTSASDIDILGPLTRDQVEKLAMNNKLNNFRTPSRQKEALGIVADSQEGLVYVAAHNNNEIVGYVLFHYPSPYSRWSKNPRIMELGAIEVSTDFKKMGIGTSLLKKAFTNPRLEDYIIITIEFYWHWDLRASGLDVWRYQKMLSKLFGRADFKKRRTNDPDILEHPANMLMVRFGSKVSDTYIKAFEDLTNQKSLVD